MTTHQVDAPDEYAVLASMAAWSFSEAATIGV